MTASGGGELVILCYHAVSDAWPWEGALGPDALDRQLRHLLGRGYRPLTLSAALAADPGERRLAITFDDAFRSVLERGLPVLERHGAPATVFVPTDHAAESAPMTWSSLGDWLGTAHEAELRCMSWDDLRRLGGIGWEIGSHTRSHPDLTALDRASAAAELSESKLACEAELGRPCASLAYPYGRRDPGVVELASSSGYESAVTLGERLLGPRRRERPLELSREGVYRSTGWPHFLAATSPSLGKLRSTRLYGRLAPSQRP